MLRPYGAEVRASDCGQEGRQIGWMQRRSMALQVPMRRVEGCRIRPVEAGENFIVRMPETRAEAASMDRGKAFGDEMKRKPPSHGLFAASLALILASIRLQLGRMLINRNW
jgi:hypothetical protein